MEQEVSAAVSTETEVAANEPSNSAIDLSLERLPSCEPTPNSEERRFDPVTREIIRANRDDGITGIIRGEALSLVHRENGLLHILNPDEESFVRNGEVRCPIQQRYALATVVSKAILRGAAEEDLFVIAEYARRRAEKGMGVEADEELVIKGATDLFFRGVRSQFNVDQFTFLYHLTEHHLSESQWQTVEKRLSRVRWLEHNLSAIAEHLGATEHCVDKRSYAEDLLEVIGDGEYAKINETLDQRFEKVSEVAELLKADSFRLVSFAKQGAQIRPIAPELVEAQELSRDHRNWQALEQLKLKLEAGESSAVGGIDYPLSRFTRTVLDGLTSGTIAAVVYDGSLEGGMNFVSEKFGRSISTSPLVNSSTTMEITGLYNSGQRHLISFKNGKQVLLMTSRGESHQLNCAATLLLYESKSGARTPVEQITLASEGIDYADATAKALTNAVAADAETPPQQTQLLMLTNPSELKIKYGENIALSEISSASIPFFLGRLKHEDGDETRLVVVKVGGSGAYGDSAAEFVKGFFAADIENKSPDVIFTGTAGGFRSDVTREPTRKQKGVGDAESGTPIIPTIGMMQFDEDRELLPIRSLVSTNALVRDNNLKVQLADSGVFFTKTHATVRAPSIETYEMINQMADENFATVDVEGAPILKAVHQLRSENPKITFTPVYAFSDDPRASAVNRYESLAMMGPLFEGSRFNAKLYDAIDVLIESSRRLKR